MLSSLPAAAPKNTVARNIALIAGILLAAILFTEFLRLLHIGSQSLAMIYFLAVLITSSATSDYICGIVAAITSSLACDFFITEPRLGFSFTIGSPITWMIMQLAAFLTSTLAIQLKQQAQIAGERANRAQFMREISQKLLSARDIPAIMRVTVTYMSTHLYRSVIFYAKDPMMSDISSLEQSPDGIALPLFDRPEEKERVRRIFQEQEHNSPNALYYTQSGIHYVPLIAKETVWGIIGIAGLEDPPNPSQQAYIRTLADQAAMALELHYISERQNLLLMETEKEKARSVLLRSISHDLRTPLTSILGASSAILEQKDLDIATVRNLSNDVRENAQWLIRMVENILSITRISQDTAKVKKTAEAAEEVIAHAVSIVRKRFPLCQIRVRIPDELLIVPMDATLISQVIINLLENALKNSPATTEILLSLRRQENRACFNIIDQGQGIPEHLLANLFETLPPPQKPAADANRGVGIGLVICKTIIQAHGGVIEGRNRPEGGAIFTFQLPIKEDEYLA